MIDVPLFYRNGKRIGQIYHARLRTDCSSLNHHLLSKNILDSPLCNCDRIETTKHYLFECNSFNEFRHEMMQGISQLCRPKSDTLIYSKRAHSDKRNKHIFITVNEHLIKTKLLK